MTPDGYHDRNPIQAPDREWWDRIRAEIDRQAARDCPECRARATAGQETER